MGSCPQARAHNAFIEGGCVFHAKTPKCFWEMVAVHHMAVVGLQPTDLTFRPIHPWAVWFSEGLRDQEMFPDLFPFYVITGFFSGIICVQSLLQDVIFSHNLIEGAPASAFLRMGRTTDQALSLQNNWPYW